MRKMNKIVALSLVLAMALSMMASAASFKDQATINADLMDEINLLVALGVYSEQGTGAGNFEPNGTITRSQAAKIIYVLKNKGVDNGAKSWTDMNIFSDVAVGSWYEGYVNYCASVGILAGTGDNKFTPNGQLTGVELAKMLLVVIGYKADLEGYTGDKWAENIIADAEAAGMFVDYELPVRGIVTREWAAQMIVNALNATKVKYEDGEAVEMYNSDNEAVTYMAQDLGLKQHHANLVATPNVKLVNSGSAANNENGKNKLSAVGTIATNTKFEFDANPELLGSKVTVLYKGSSLANATKIYGVTAHVDNIITDTTVDAVEFDADNFEDSVYFAVDYVMQDTMDADALDEFFAANDGRALKMVDRDNDGKIDIMLTNSVAYDEIEYINPANHIVRFVTNDTLDISGGAAADREEAWEEVNFVDSVVAEDIVKITKDFSTGKEITNIELVDVVTGAVTKKSGSTYTIDGGSYKLSAFAFEGTSIAVNSTAKNYYVDGQYVVATDEISDNEVENTNVALVVKKSADNQTDEWGNAVKKVDVLKNDGTRETLSYKVYTSNKPAGYVDFDNVTPGRIAEYVMKDGKIYFKTLTVNADKGIGQIDAVAAKEYDKSEAKFTDGNGTFLVTEDTYFFIVDEANDNYAVATAAEIKGDMHAANGTKFGYNANGMPYLYFAVLTGEIPGAESSTGTAITANAQTEELDENGDKIYKLVATKLDGTEITLVSEDSMSDCTNQFVTYTIDTDGMVSELDKKTFTNAYHHVALTNVESTSGIMVSYDGENSTYVDLADADDLKIYYVDAYQTSAGADRIIVSEAEGLVAADELDDDTFALNALVKIVEGEIVEIIVEVQGEEIPDQFFDIAE